MAMKCEARSGGIFKFVAVLPAIFLLVLSPASACGVCMHDAMVCGLPFNAHWLKLGLEMWLPVAALIYAAQRRKIPLTMGLLAGFTLICSVVAFLPRFPYGPVAFLWAIPLVFIPVAPLFYFIFVCWVGFKGLVSMVTLLRRYREQIAECLHAGLGMALRPLSPEACFLILNSLTFAAMVIAVPYSYYEVAQGGVRFQLSQTLSGEYLERRIAEKHLLSEEQVIDMLQTGSESEQKHALHIMEYSANAGYIKPLTDVIGAHGDDVDAQRARSTLEKLKSRINSKT